MRQTFIQILLNYTCVCFYSPNGCSVPCVLSPSFCNESAGPALILQRNTAQPAVRTCVFVCTCVVYVQICCRVTPAERSCLTTLHRNRCSCLASWELGVCSQREALSFFISNNTVQRCSAAACCNTLISTD